MQWSNNKPQLVLKEIETKSYSLHFLLHEFEFARSARVDALSIRRSPNVSATPLQCP